MNTGFKVLLTTEDGELLEQWLLRRPDDPDNAWLADDGSLSIRTAYILSEEIREQINARAWGKP